MDIMKIRKDARALYRQNTRVILTSFYILSIFSYMFQILNSGWLILLSQIILVTLPHGYIYIALKAIQEKKLTKITVHDILIGILDLLKYLPSYLIRLLTIYLSTFGLLLLALIVSTPGNTITLYQIMNDVVSFIVQRGLNQSATYTLFENLNLVGYGFIIASVLVYMLLNILFSLVPYIVEDYDYSWYEALTKSVQLISGHKKEFVYLIISFVPQLLLFYSISIGALIPLSFLGMLGYLIYMIFMNIIQIELYLADYHISLGMFYLMIRDEKIDENEIYKIK